MSQTSESHRVSPGTGSVIHVLASILDRIYREHLFHMRQMTQVLQGRAIQKTIGLLSSHFTHKSLLLLCSQIIILIIFIVFDPFNRNLSQS